MTNPRDDAPRIETAPARRASPWRPWLRALVLALLLASLLLVAAWGFYRTAVYAPAPGRPEPARAPGGPSLTALSVSSPAERGRHGGDWTPLQTGSELRADEEIRTGPGGGAELSAGERARIKIAERTQLSVRELREDLHRYRLARGRVLVDYEADGERAVRIEGEGGTAAEARRARFAVASDGLVFAVATETGRVDLSAAGASMTVEAGRQAAARGGGPPSVGRPVPTEVLLAVAAAGRAGPGARCLDTTGRADPDAFVTIDGVQVPVDGRGRFPIRVDRVGGDPVEIVATLPDGRTATRSVPCARPDEARVRDIEVRWRREP